MRVPIVVWVLLIAGCSSPAAEGDRPADTDSPNPSKATSPTFRAASEQPIREDDVLTGVLGADSVEGGCAYLETVDGTRYEVLYPRGWNVTVSPLELTDPDGDVVARAGDRVTVRGSETREVASICQIGPIFRATSVQR